MTPPSRLPSPGAAVAAALETFRAWWAREGLALVRPDQDAEWARLFAQAAYLRGLMDGGREVFRVLCLAVEETIAACRFCGAPLPAEPEDPVVRELGRLCPRCAAEQDEARGLLE
jgi:hypothetical protein